MLDKINNISAGSDFTKAVHTSSFGSILSSSYTHKVDAHDFADISPAFKFLNSINWKLKEFKHVENEKLFLGFIISDIEFHTAISLVNFEKIDMLGFNISKENKEGNKSAKIITDLSVKVDGINYNREPSLINFSAFNVFFQRIFDLNVYREITREDKYLMDMLLEGIFFGIKEEFHHLNNLIFIFVDKLTGQRVSKKENKRDNYGESVVFKKFKVLNVE